jgi:hypothetical protein
MFREVYYVHPKGLSSYVIAVLQLLCGFLNVRSKVGYDCHSWAGYSSRSVAFLAVKVCLEGLFMVFKAALDLLVSLKRAFLEL